MIQVHCDRCGAGGEYDETKPGLSDRFGTRPAPPVGWEWYAQDSRDRSLCCGACVGQLLENLLAAMRVAFR